MEAEEIKTINRTIKLGPLTFTVLYEDLIIYNEDDGTEVDIKACACMDNLTIRINNNLPKELREKYLLHECIEMYNKMYAINLTHDQIDILETVFFDFIKNNDNRINR